MKKIVPYSGICKMTNRKETIWVEQIINRLLDGSESVSIGLRNDCSVRQRTGELNMCEDCNIQNSLPKI